MFDLNEVGTKQCYYLLRFAGFVVVPGNLK